MNKRPIPTFFLVCFFAFCAVSWVFGSLLHKHEWLDATCTEPRTCSSCRETEGKALGHDWMDATCTTPQTCRRCGITQGHCADHTWTPATCTEPERCAVCEKKRHWYSSPLGHDWIDATYTAPKTCSRCGVTDGEPLQNPSTEDSIAQNLYNRGRYDRWSGTPRINQYIGMTGYVGVAYNSFLYSSTDTPYENDWFFTPWKATTYEKDKQFWNAVGTVEHKTQIVVVDVELVPGCHGTYRYSGYLLVKQIDNNSQFYISVTDFVAEPYWENKNISDILYVGPCLAVYHQVSDYYPIDGRDRKADIADGSIVLVHGAASGGRGFGNSDTNTVDALTTDGKCYFNPNDLTIIY